MLNGNVTPSDANSDNAGLASGTIAQILAHRRTRAATAAHGDARSPPHDPGTVWEGVRHSVPKSFAQNHRQQPHLGVLWWTLGEGSRGEHMRANPDTDPYTKHGQTTPFEWLGHVIEVSAPHPEQCGAKPR